MITTKHFALTQVSPKGEIVVLDTSSNAAFTITKSVTIVAAPGAYVVSNAVAGRTAITVTIGTADSVVLRGLTIGGQSVGNTGMMNIDSSLASNNDDSGVAASDNGSVARVSNTMLVNNSYVLKQGSSGSTVISRGNNTVLGNTNNQTYGTITYETTPR